MDDSILRVLRNANPTSRTNVEALLDSLKEGESDICGRSITKKNGQFSVIARFGAYRYSILLSKEELTAICMGLATISSRSGGRGRRTDIKIVAKVAV